MPVAARRGLLVAVGAIAGAFALLGVRMLAARAGWDGTAEGLGWAAGGSFLTAWIAILFVRRTLLRRPARNRPQGPA